MVVAAGLLYFIKDALAVLSLVYLLKTIFGEKLRKQKTGIIVSVAVPVFYSVAAHLFLLPVFNETYELLDAVSNFFYIAAVFLCLKKPAVLRSLSVLFVYIFTVDMLWSFVATFFDNSIIAECIFNSLLFGTVFFAVMKLSGREDVNVLAGAFREVPRWMIISLLLFELTCYYKEFGVSADWYDFLYAVSACMIFVCILALVLRVFRLVYMQNTILLRLNEQLEFSEHLSRSDEALRSFRHDYKNHIIVINSLFEQGDTEGAKKYFEKLKNDTSFVMNTFSTGNSVVNSLLNIKNTDAKKCNAVIEFSGIVPEKGIDNKDMCIAVGNLTDNAIDACMKLPSEMKKIIRVSGAVKSNMLLLSVKNPCIDEKQKRTGGLFATTKKDTKAHGIGLKNVKAVAQKYQGELILNREKGEFTAEMILYLTE